MKHKGCFLSFVASAALLCVSISSVFAKAPATAKIVFRSSRDNNREIYIMNPDGSGQVRLTHHRADDAMPTWSPTGEQILFASDRDRFRLSRDLYLMDPDGTNVRRVFGKSKHRSSAAWSPDGKQIAYKSGTHIYIGTIDGKKEEHVATGSGPAWSPDGAEIAFVAGRWPDMTINIFNLRTKKQKVLFPQDAHPSWISGDLDWSPTVDKIAFSWNRDAVKKDIDLEALYIINSDGTGLQQITRDAAPRETSPVWSPQGDALLYDKTDKHNRLQIFKISLGSDVSEQLTDTFIPKVLGNFFQANSPGDWFDPAFALPVAPQPRLATTIWGQIKQQ